MQGLIIENYIDMSADVAIVVSLLWYPEYNWDITAKKTFTLISNHTKTYIHYAKASSHLPLFSYQYNVIIQLLRNQTFL